MNILLGVTGGIAAYKAADVARGFVKHGCTVRVIMTAAAREFITPLTFSSLTSQKVYTDMFAPPDSYDIEHISLAKWADRVVIAPATANFIGKMAGGICDDFLTTVVCAVNLRCPVYVAPAMNTEMWRNAVTARNVKFLEELGYGFIPPRTSLLACGDIGEGALAETDVIVRDVLAEKC